MTQEQLNCLAQVLQVLVAIGGVICIYFLLRIERSLRKIIKDLEKK